MAQMNIILGLSLLLAVGFALAYFARLAQLPSVTGYILAGILLGSSGFNLIDKELIHPDSKYSQTLLFSWLPYRVAGWESLLELLASPAP